MNRFGDCVQRKQSHQRYELLIETYSNAIGHLDLNCLCSEYGIILFEYIESLYCPYIDVYSICQTVTDCLMFILAELTHTYAIIF